MSEKYWMPDELHCAPVAPAHVQPQLAFAALRPALPSYASVGNDVGQVGAAGAVAPLWSKSVTGPLHPAGTASAQTPVHVVGESVDVTTSEAEPSLLAPSPPLVAS
jgi:hypothetical protein